MISINVANLNMAADRRQIASVFLGIISSLLACMQLNVALLNAEISYARRRRDICKLLTLSTAQNGWQKQLRRAGKQCSPRRFWVRPGRTSAWWANFSVNPNTWTGEFDLNTLWSHNLWTRIYFRSRKEKVADSKISRYVWTGPKDYESSEDDYQSKTYKASCSRKSLLLCFIDTFTNWGLTANWSHQDGRCKFLGFKNETMEARSSLFFCLQISDVSEV